MNALVAAARQFKGTPFRHRGRTARAVDCVGLGVLAFRACGVEIADFILYSTEPSGEGSMLVDRIAAALGAPVAVAPVSVDLLAVGDVVAMRFAAAPHHVGILGDYRFGGLSLIHADGHTGRVVEHRLAADHVARITHVFRRPV